MPGKHAPASPRSFYLSVGRAVAGAMAVLALVVLIAMAAVSGGDPAPPVAQRTTEPPKRATPTTTSTPTEVESPTSTPTDTAPTLRKRSRISVLVLNATNRAGLAARVRTELLEAGYDDVEIGNDTDRARSIVYYRGSTKPEAGRLLKDLDASGAVRRAPDDFQGDARLTLILGADFQE